MYLSETCTRTWKQVPYICEVKYCKNFISVLQNLEVVIHHYYNMQQNAGSSVAGDVHEKSIEVTMIDSGLRYMMLSITHELVSLSTGSGQLTGILVRNQKRENRTRNSVRLSVCQSSIKGGSKSSVIENICIFPNIQ